MRSNFNPNMPPLTFVQVPDSDDEEEKKGQEEENIGYRDPAILLPNGRKQYKVAQLDTAVQIAKNNGKYSLVFEPMGATDMFFKVLGKMTEFQKTVIGMKIGQITKEEGLDSLRSNLVRAMNVGERYCIMIGNIAPDFKNEYNHETFFPGVDKVFRFEHFRQKEVYKSILKPEEDMDLQGNKGCYFMAEDFTIVILSTAKTAEERQKVIDGIPNVDTDF